MTISTNEFIRDLGIALDKNLITGEQYDDYMYECAVTQAYDPDQLSMLMETIINHINGDLADEKEPSEE